ncbi:hypothetical protein C8246_12670 [Paracidovorax avenae]|uniref:hypothetical protein n=1 Tax=Paracidovorax avenae TaxID=80867 RepID=UPI000D22CD07|nr:hypothetical protein [Paracidovorax avenae]AVS76851.1 hypothetical protein C8234_01450 [Paracidovorax avenae]AVS92499.1 hypothetical protein C8246_12670 [Paracidovorax avenae]
MLAQLNFIPDAFLYSIGRCNRQDRLHELLEAQETPTRDLRRPEQGRPYHVQVGPYGVDLTMQCVNPSAPDRERMWGLHGVTLHTAASHQTRHWKGPWPDGLDLARAEARDVAEWLSPGDEMARTAPPTMVCLLVDGIDDRPWTVLCTFDAMARTLRTFSVMRADEEWVVASTLPPWPRSQAAASISPPPTPEAEKDTAELICRSHAIVPKTGLWEARLPTAHPRARDYSRGEWRFAYRKQGDTMSSLGVPDEDLVVWTWLRASR